MELVVRYRKIVWMVGDYIDLVGIFVVWWIELDVVGVRLMDFDREVDMEIGGIGGFVV